LFTPGDAVDFQRLQRRDSKKLEAVGSGSKILEAPDLHVFFPNFSSESNSEVPASEMASHLELRETRTPDIHTVDDVDGKHLEQSFRELEVTEELH